jgi:hypothetical protein
MDDERARRFWERALRDIRDEGFFTSVQTAEPPPAPVAQRERRLRLRLTNLHLVLIVITISLIVTLVVLNWLAPALF